jgi:hypothetical protein
VLYINARTCGLCNSALCCTSVPFVKHISDLGFTSPRHSNCAAIFMLAKRKQFEVHCASCYAPTEKKTIMETVATKVGTMKETIEREMSVALKEERGVTFSSVQEFAKEIKMHRDRGHAHKVEEVLPECRRGSVRVYITAGSEVARVSGIAPHHQARMESVGVGICMWYFDMIHGAKMRLCHCDVRV